MRETKRDRERGGETERKTETEREKREEERGGRGSIFYARVCVFSRGREGEW